MNDKNVWLNSSDFSESFINVSFNNMNYNDLLNIDNSNVANNLIDNSLLLSSYESLVKNDSINAYQMNYLSFIDKNNPSISFIENKYISLSGNVAKDEIISINWKYAKIQVKYGDTFLIKSEGNNSVSWAFTDMLNNIKQKISANSDYSEYKSIKAEQDGYLIINFNKDVSPDYGIIPVNWSKGQKPNNIIPLTYNVKYENGIIGLDSNIIKVNIDNYTIKDSVDLPRKKTIELTYIYKPGEFTIPMDIIDSYSYIINSYEYRKNENDIYSYKVEYDYSLYATYELTYENKDMYLAYNNDSYSYYIYSYEFESDDLNIAYHIKYSYSNISYISYSYIFSYTYLINQFDNDFIYVDEENLDKANYDIGIFKSDKDSMKINNDLLSINDKYSDLIYLNRISEYNNIYNTLNKRYKELLIESTLFNTYAFNYNAVEDLCILFAKDEEIIYFDKNKKIGDISYIGHIQIDNDIEEFNLCIPFEYSYKSYIEEINPIDLNKILINIFKKITKITKKVDEETYDEPFNIILNEGKDNEIVIDVANYFDYNNILDENFQPKPEININGNIYEYENIYDDLISYYYNINYYHLDNYYSVADELIKFINLDLENSYLVDKQIEKYENGKYYGKARYVFNFKIDKEGYKNVTKNKVFPDFYINNFDIIMTIKDSILGGCDVINPNYRLNFTFYIVENNELYHNETQTYDIIYHDYNVGFNFKKQGEMLGICFCPQYFNKNNYKPIFCKYTQYNDIVKLPEEIIIDNTFNLSTINETANVPILFKDNNIKYFNNKGIVSEDVGTITTINSLTSEPEEISISKIKSLKNITNIDISDDVYIKEEYLEDKISKIKFDYIKKNVELIKDNSDESESLDNSDDKTMDINIDIENNKIIMHEGNGINNIFDNKNIQNLYDITNKYIKEIYDLSSSGIRNGDYYIPTIYQYYIMSLYNILSLYKFDSVNFASSLICNSIPIYAIVDQSKENKYKISSIRCDLPILGGYFKIPYGYVDKDNNNKYIAPTIKEYYDLVEKYDYDNQEDPIKDNNYDNCILPIFKIPDYSIINDGIYNITFDKELNHECVVIITPTIGYFKLKIKKYYDVDDTSWLVEEKTNTIKKIYHNYNIPDKDNKEIAELIVSYAYDNDVDKINKILVFDVGFIDSDSTFNTYNINGNNCRILCKVIIKIKS